MIAVIADDLTGAAELAGIGLRYGLRVEMNMSVDPDTDADLLVIATDTRSMTEAAATAIMAGVTSALLPLRPHIIFKKTDSVLRGHILAELGAQLKVVNQRSALLVPANPALGRTITGGDYYLNGQPIHRSSFAHDPEFPITSSRVADMLRAAAGSLNVLKPDDPMPGSGILVGEATDAADLNAWADRIGDHLLTAGASGFFTAILDRLIGAAPTPDQSAARSAALPRLFVCGTTYGVSRTAIRTIKDKGGPVSYMPVPMVRNNGNDVVSARAWSLEVAALLSDHGQAIMAIDEAATAGAPVSPGDLSARMAGAVAAVMEQADVPELIIEGGATAAAIFKRQDYTRFTPVQELAPGVIRMRVEGTEGLHITLKPGSYAWPADVWDF